MKTRGSHKKNKTVGAPANEDHVWEETGGLSTFIASLYIVNHKRKKASPQTQTLTLSITVSWAGTYFLVLLTA